MTLGGMDPARYETGSTVPVKNINKLGFWEVPISQVKIDGNSTGWTNRTGVLDTGTVCTFLSISDTFLCDCLISIGPLSSTSEGEWPIKS